ncbi:MAG TPA: chemotaxis protein CheA [Gammaproteobacteria bacterium]|nr:chemotaxis protein CheA [Gammaproteobacteria bacterium]
MDEELLEDFMLEAGELVEQLGEQLVDLENSPEDADLLNGVFRAFHTIKGGASFLSLEALIRVCHSAENVFNTLRNGERVLTPDLMDSVLQALDVLVNMFEELRAGEPLTPAPEGLIIGLDQYAEPASADDALPPAETGHDQDVHDQDVGVVPDGHSSLPVTAGQGATDQGAPQGNNDLIDDAEFEALLDDLHGVAGAEEKAIEEAGPEEHNKRAADSAVEKSSEEISEEEFESLLDELEKVRNATVEIETADEKGGDTASASASSPASATRESVVDKPNAERAVSDVSDEELAALQAEIAMPVPLTAGQQSGAESDHVSKVPGPDGTLIEDRRKATEEPALVPGPDGALIQERRKAPRKEGGESNLRVETQVLDDIMNMVGELVLVRNRLSNLIAESADEELTKAVTTLNLVTSQLQDSAMKTRMQPIRKVFGRFPRVVRDLARSLGKEVKLVTEGEDTDLDKNLVDALADPLIHLVRNSVDHGVEAPDEREKNGKSRSGTVTLSAGQEGDRIVISIRDDGAGMDAERLRAIAVQKGIMSTEEAARLSDREAYELIFAPGFSSKQEVTDVSGRGVGMDVVKTAISQLSGSVEIESELGVGTQFTIRVPLTLAIVGSLMIGVGERLFALPVAVVEEIFSFDPTQAKVVDGQHVVVRKEEVLPFFVLGKWLLREISEEVKEHYVVVVSVGTKRMGLLVDRLLGQEDVVIKPLGPELQDIGGFAGATINGDGRMALILDVPGLIRSYA